MIKYLVNAYTNNKYKSCHESTSEGFIFFRWNNKSKCKNKSKEQKLVCFCRSGCLYYIIR